MGLMDWAVVIGINHYRHLGTLRGPHNDADRFEAWVRDASGLGDPNVRSVRSTASPTAPTRDPLVLPFLELAEELEATKAGGRLWIYVAGHGVDPDILSTKAPVLLAANARAGWYTQHLDVVNTAQWFRYSGYFREVVLFADCCRTDAPRTPRMPTFDGGGAAGTGAQTRYFAGFATRWSATARERAGEGGVVSGVFTDAVLAGLRGAPPDGEGRVLPDRFSSFVRDRVLKERPNQNPEFDAPDPDLVLARVQPPAPLTLHVPAGVTATLTDGQAVRAVHTGPGSFPVTIEPGIYKVVTDPPGPPRWVEFPEEGSVHV
jgi:uncharacterized caspase-like protein